MLNPKNNKKRIEKEFEEELKEIKNDLIRRKAEKYFQDVQDEDEKESKDLKKKINK